MDFSLSSRCQEFRERLLTFMDERVYLAERTWHEQIEASGDRTFIRP
jgi:acyl-CoA dehydrogenase